MSLLKSLVAPREGITYLKHQEVGVRWMLAREEADADVCRGGILGDDMGLGKTFQTIGLLRNGQAWDGTRPVWHDGFASRKAGARARPFGA